MDQDHLLIRSVTFLMYNALSRNSVVFLEFFVLWQLYCERVCNAQKFWCVGGIICIVAAILSVTIIYKIVQPSRSKPTRKQLMRNYETIQILINNKQRKLFYFIIFIHYYANRKYYAQ